MSDIVSTVIATDAQVDDALKVLQRAENTRCISQMAATIYTERLIYDNETVAARKAVDDACLIYAMVEKRLEEAK